MTTTNTTLSHYIPEAEAIVTKILEAESAEAQAGLMKEYSEPVCNIFIRQGDFALKHMDTEGVPSDAEMAEYYFTTFLWPDQVKAFMLLWRDIEFQLQKAQVLLAEGKATPEAVQNLHKKSCNILREAFENLNSLLQTQLQELLVSPSKTKRKLTAWGHQQNPWLLYKKQIEKIPGQCARLAEDFTNLHTLTGIFARIRTMICDTLAACIREIQDHKALTHDLISREMKEGEAGTIQRFASRLEALENEIIVKPWLSVFSEKIEEQINLLPQKLSFTVTPGAGMLEVAELNLRRRVQLWLESQVLPLLNEIWELTENTSNGLKMTIVNIRNRILILTAENREGRAGEVEKTDFLLSLQTFLHNLEKREEQMPALDQLIRERLDAEFYVSGLYENPATYLYLPLQSPVGRFSFTRNKVIGRIRTTLSPYITSLTKFVKTVEKGDVLSPPEKIVRYIQSRKGESDGSHYSSIFLTRGYVGESFIVGRDDELDHVKKVWENWKIGYRGTVALTGKRLSGKTLFGELIGLKLFPESVIALRPGQVLNLNGRKTEVGFDLGKALGFIRKYAAQEKTMIWIDDLELWWSPEISLAENARMLIKYIDSHATGHFVVVALGTPLYRHLCRSLDFQNIFQAEINMDYMSVSEIESAIWIRHGATHKNLVNAEGEEISNREFDRQINLVYRASGGIIGDALSLWSNSTTRLDEINVWNNFSQKYELPPLESPDMGLLLASVMLQKRTNEYRLRKLFGPAFPERYQSLVRRMLSMGMLVRQMDDWLEIDDTIVNDLGRMLQEGKYIHYNHQ
ncbi:MAG: hypothetical protein R3C61_16300 [Bacteroidia bacterium]